MRLFLILILLVLLSVPAEARFRLSQWKDIRAYFWNLPPSFENVEKALLMCGIQHREIVMKQFRLESGNFKSKLATKAHNLAGMKKARRRFTTAVGTYCGHARYLSWIDCILDYKIWQGDAKIDDYYEFLKRRNYNPAANYQDRLR